MLSNTSPKVWFITGCSSGVGFALTQEALNRGDKVIATARNVGTLDELQKAGADVMQLDVTAPLPTLRDLAQKAHGLYGRIDYLVNNAGFGITGTFEELSPEEFQAQYDANVFGLLNTTRAVLPFMRAARSGVIGNVSSITAWGGFPGGGAYSSSKHAVSGISEAMTGELVGFGIHVCCIEMGFFRTKVLSAQNLKSAAGSIADYEGTVSRQADAGLRGMDGKQPGDIRKAVKVMFDVLSNKAGKGIPMRLALGSDAYGYIKKQCEDTIELLEEWKDVGINTDFDDDVKN